MLAIMSLCGVYHFKPRQRYKYYTICVNNDSLYAMASREDLCSFFLPFFSSAKTAR